MNNSDDSDFFVLSNWGRVVCQRQNRKAQRWMWFWCKDEFELLSHTEVEKTVIYPKGKYIAFS